MDDRKLRATCYYPHLIQVLPGPWKGDRHKDWPDRIEVRFEGGGALDAHVDPHEHYLAAIEASAILDLSVLSPMAGKLGIGYHGGHWHCYPWAPWGVGTRENALVPGRDFAHGYKSGWSFGTQLTLTDRPQEIVGLIRNVIYRGDSFGDPDKDKPENEDRVDLFLGEVCQYFGPIRGIVRKPWDGVSSHPTKGAQECLVALGVPDMDGQALVVDGAFGKRTAYALEQWVKNTPDRFRYGLPPQIKPWDSEIFWQLRDAAKAAKEGGP